MRLHSLVDDIVSTYLTEIDIQAPGLLEGLYLVGSVAMDDFQVGGRIARRGPSGVSVSDIDFVAITSRPLAEPDLAAIDRAHRALTRHHQQPFFDGLYLTWPDLPHDPARATCSARTHDGRLHHSNHNQAIPVIWHELAQQGLAIRGPRPATLDIWTDHDTLIAWVQANLDTYWRQWHRRSSRLLTRPGLACLTSFGPTWGVLGVSRLHYTLITGKIISKTGVGSTPATYSTPAGIASSTRACGSAPAPAGAPATPARSPGAVPPWTSSRWSSRKSEINPVESTRTRATPYDRFADAAPAYAAHTGSCLAACTPPALWQ